MRHLKPCTLFRVRANFLLHFNLESRGTKSLTVDTDAAISELVIANRVVAHLKLVDSFGHVTVRNPENPQRFFMSRARAPGLVTKEDILEFNLESTRWV